MLLPTWKALVQTIDKMEAKNEFAWAGKTLRGIRKSVAARAKVTRRQFYAIQNIYARRAKVFGPWEKFHDPKFD